jgi:hypothetical protein
LQVYGGLCVISLYQILAQDCSTIGLGKDVLPEKVQTLIEGGSRICETLAFLFQASISYFKRASYDPSNGWPNESTSSVIAVDRATPPTVTIHRECQLRSSLQLPDQCILGVKTCILPKKKPVIKQIKQVRIQAPDRLQKG